MRNGLGVHRRFLVLAGLFVIAALIHTFSLLVMEGSDESLHQNYAEYLRQENRLPDRFARRTNGIAQASGQPPLAYWLMSLPPRLLNLPITNPQETMSYLERVENRWHWPRDLWQQHDNKNFYYHGDGEAAFNNPLLVEVNRAMRWVSLLLGVIAVIGAYGAAREVFRDERWALTATALFAFTPTMLHASAYVTNDTAAIAFSTLAIWQTLRLLNRGASPARLILIGVLLALGALSKVNALLVAPGVGLAVLLDCYNTGFSWRRLIGHGLLIGLPLVLFFGPWVLYGTLNYGDPLGLGTHQYAKLGFYSVEPRSIADTMKEVPAVYLSYWGKFLHVLMQPSTYHALGLILVLAAVGYLLYLRPGNYLRWQSRQAQQGLVLGVMIVLSAAALFRWMQQLLVVGARLIYPVHIAVALCITGGLYLLAHDRPRVGLFLRSYAAGIVIATGLLISPLALRRGFGLPAMLQHDQLPALQGPQFDYAGVIRFLGYTQESSIIRGNLHPVTLCWEVLQSTDRPAAFSLKFVHNSPIVADRTSILGMGHFNSVLWQPGDIFCDDFLMHMDDPDTEGDPLPEPAYVYDMLLVLLDSETLAVDWQATTPDDSPVQFPIIGQVVSPAGDMSATLTQTTSPTDIAFPGLANLSSYAIDGNLSPGAQVDLSLLWEVTGQTPNDWTQFIHLVGPDTAVVLADGTPRGGNYPTWAWSTGERIVDRWTLTIPADLPAGDYDLMIGFYRKDSGERLSAVQDGSAVVDNAPVLIHLPLD